MYRVLIAEDEMLVRLGLKHSIPWEAHGMVVVGDVANGQEALELYKREMPDVLITDIKMPIMDGMELIARVRELNADVQIVILTCVEDFDTARKALAHNVQDYMLKLEMTTEDMGKILAKVRERLDRLHRSEQLKAEVDVHILKENLIKEFLLGQRYSEAEFAAKAESLGMNLQAHRVVVTLMEIDSFEILCKRFKDEKGQLIRMSLLNVLHEVLGNYGFGEAFADAENRYLFVFGFGEDYSDQQAAEAVRTITEHIRSVLDMYFNISVSFVTHHAQAGYYALKVQYSACLAKLEDRFFLGTSANSYAGGEQLQHIPEAIGQALLQLVREWKTNEAAQDTLGAAMQSFLAPGMAVSAVEIRRTFKIWGFIAALSSRLPNMGMPELVSDYSDRITEARTLQELVDVLRAFLQSLSEYVSSKAALSKEIADAITHIDANYNRELTLAELSQIVQVSPNYLSSLFKKETGINFVDYLLQYRIDRAKELLLGTYYKTYEIAEQTGFTNQSYFSRAFKKHTGLGPKAFRRKWTPHKELQEGDEHDEE